MEISGEVANFHMRTDAKNLVTTARTIHLPEQKEIIHMISMLRKEACSGSIHDLAHTPTQNCLADCLTKASAKADNLITAVKTRRLPDVDIHLGFRTRMKHKAFLSTWCRISVFTRENKVFLLNTLKIHLAPTSQEGSFQVMFVGTQHTQEQKEPKTCEREGQNATKLTPALAEISLASNVDLDENIVSVSGSHEPFVQYCASLFQLCDHGSIETASRRDRRLLL